MLALLLKKETQCMESAYAANDLCSIAAPTTAIALDLEDLLDDELEELATREDFDALNATHEFLVYGKPGCSRCKSAINTLTSAGADYKFVDLGLEPEWKRYLEVVNGYLYYPQIVHKGKIYSGTTALDYLRTAL